MSVHVNSRYLPVQKFVILKGHLSGVALQCIKVIPVSDACYQSTVETLKGRFHKSEIVKDEIIKGLLSMPCVGLRRQSVRHEVFCGSLCVTCQNPGGIGHYL